MEILRLRLTAKDEKQNLIKITELFDKTVVIGNELEKLRKEAEAAKAERSLKFEAYDKANEELYKNGKVEAEKFDPEHLKASKVDTLIAVRDMFSNNRTRFMVSTYFDLFSAYLLKKGIKIDGSLVNAKIYDEVLEESTRSELGKDNLERKDALDLGKMFSTEMKSYSDDIFKAKQKNIKSERYLKEYNSLENLQKSINQREDGLVNEIKDSFERILAKRNPKDKKKKKNTKPLTDVEFVFDTLSEEERFMLKKYGRVVSAKLSNEDGDDWYGLDNKKQNEITKYRKLIILMDINERIGTRADTEANGIAAALLTTDEKNILSSYNNEFMGQTGKFKDVDYRLDGLKAFVQFRDKKFMQAHVNKYFEDNKDELFSINS